jgi:acyl-coenzyme A synthetase/AMP-(fatty) acid ligase
MLSFNHAPIPQHATCLDYTSSLLISVPKRITAPYKYPREIEFVKELPKTISGKIKRKTLRTREFDRKRAVIETLKEKGLWRWGE